MSEPAAEISDRPALVRLHLLSGGGQRLVTLRTHVRGGDGIGVPSSQTDRVDAALPPGWPDEVAPPGAPDWERTAVAWLYDLVPHDYRAHEVLRRYPVLLARFAADHVAAGLEAARAGWRTVRVELADQLPPDAIEAAISAYEREGARLSRAARGVEVVAGALRGERWVPRL